MFGGLELCSLEAIVDAGGREFIIEVNDCAMGLLGDGQDEDRRLIADIVINKMEVCSALAVTIFLNIPPRSSVRFPQPRRSRQLRRLRRPAVGQDLL